MSGTGGTLWWIGDSHRRHPAAQAAHARGMRRAWAASMRSVLVLLVAGGCIGGSLDSGMRPAVIPKLSELPADSGKRDAVLDSANVTTGPEQGSSSSSSSSSRALTKKERRAVTTAAFGAAVLGWLFSDTENVTLGGAVSIDENELFVPSTPAATKDPEARPADGVPPEAPPAPQDLVPWVKLK